MMPISQGEYESPKFVPGLATEDDVLAALQDLVIRSGSQKSAAEKLKISAQYMSDLLAGRRKFSASVAAKLGFFPAWEYRP